MKVLSNQSLSPRLSLLEATAGSIDTKPPMKMQGNVGGANVRLWMFIAILACVLCRSASLMCSSSFTLCAKTMSVKLLQGLWQI